MSVCPGCGRCRQCGQPAPIYPRPYVYPAQPIWWTTAAPTWGVQTSGFQGGFQINPNQTGGQSDQAL
jgi:hypothetical protein